MYSFLYSRSSSTRYVAMWQILTTHLPSASERALSLFSPLITGLTLVCWEEFVSEYIQPALSRWKSSRKSSVSQDRLLVLCNAPLSNRHGKSWESISFVSAFTRVWAGQACAKVSIGPWYVWYHSLNLNISGFICQLILARSLPLPQCHQRYGVMLFHT